MMGQSLKPYLLGIERRGIGLRSWLVAGDGHVLDHWEGASPTPECASTVTEQSTVDHVRKAFGMRASGVPTLVCGFDEVRIVPPLTPIVACPASIDDIAGCLTSGDKGVIAAISAQSEISDLLTNSVASIFGALDRYPEIAGSSVIIVPGQHSRWVSIENNRIVDIQTFMTGDMYSALSRRNLNVFGSQEFIAQAVRGESFGRGVELAAQTWEGLSPLLFSARSQFLSGTMDARACDDYLLGIIVGDEIRAGTSREGREAMKEVVLLGDSATCMLYERGFDILGVTPPRRIEDMTPAGMFAIARRASLV